MELLARVYGEDLVVDEVNEERGLLRGRDGKRILRGSMTLLTCVSFLALTDTSHLVVKNANFKIINDIKQVTKCF